MSCRAIRLLMLFGSWDGALGVDENRRERPELGGLRPNSQHARGVVCERAVREIQLKDVHSSPNHLLDCRLHIADGPEGGDDLGMPRAQATR